MNFDNVVDDSSLSELRALEEAIKEAFLPAEMKDSDLSVGEEVFFPESAKLRSKILMADDRNIILDKTDLSKNKQLELIDDVDALNNFVIEGDDGQSVETSFDDIPQEAFLPDFEGSSVDVAMARDVFFPKEGDEVLDNNSFDEKIFFDRHENLKTLMLDIKSLLDSGRIYHAKKTYNDLVNKLKNSSLSKEEGLFLKEKIKALYDEIHLKNLEVEALKRLERN